MKSDLSINRVFCFSSMKLDLSINRVFCFSSRCTSDEERSLLRVNEYRSQTCKRRNKLKDEGLHIFISAGGTGGHIFPALAIAEKLREQNIKVSWLGNTESLEARIAAQSGFSFYGINAFKLRRSGLKNLILFPFKFLKALKDTHVLFRTLKPSLVLGLGGFVSGTSGLCAIFHRIPLFIHEQNSIPGFTNRILAYGAKKVFQSFPNTFKHRKSMTTGNPIRQTLEEVASPLNRPRGIRATFHLLILGGSQGAHFINEILPEAIAQLLPEERPLIWHQTGQTDAEKVQKYYESIGIPAKISPFIENMNEAYEFADFVVSRAGATTIAELSYVGLGSLLIPYPHAVDDHQTRNAEFLSQAGAAFLEKQIYFTTTQFTIIWRNLLENQKHFQKMALAAYHLQNKQSAATTIAQLCIEESYV